MGLCKECGEREARRRATDCNRCHKRKERRRGRLQTIVVLADVHVPEHHGPSWRALLAWLAGRSPSEVVIAGDFLELASVGEHGTVADAGSLQADLDAGKSALRELRAAVGDVPITYLEGNHETRLTRYIERNAAPLAGVLSLPDALGLDALGIRWIPEREQPIARGGLRILHGHQDLRLPPKYHAAKMADLRGRAGGTVVYGHTHRPQVISRQGDEPATAIGLGCLRTLAPAWERGRASGWQHGFAVAYLRPDGSADVYPVPVRGGAIAWDGRLYAAAG